MGVCKRVLLFQPTLSCYLSHRKKCCIIQSLACLLFLLSVSRPATAQTQPTAQAQPSEQTQSASPYFSATPISSTFRESSPYWQQQVNYIIDVTLNDRERTLDGFLKIQYHNQSPDTLSFIWFHVWPNAFKNDGTAFSEQLLGNGRTDFYFSDQEQKGYINRLDFRVNGAEARMEDHPLYIDIIKVVLPTPLPPGGLITITTPFHEKLPYNFSRGGFRDKGFQITQWYPKPAVYDQKGWHPIPYLDQGEFYSEYGNFDVRITLPKDYVVGATGELQDSPGKQETGIQKSAASDNQSSITKNNALPVTQQSKSNNQHNSKSLTQNAKSNTQHNPPTNTKPNSRPFLHHPKSNNQDNPPAPNQNSTTNTQNNNPPATKTLRYLQENVHDFAWFASKRYRVDHDTLQLRSGRIIDVYSFYIPSAESAWNHSVSYIKQAVRYRSGLIGEYPFNVVSAAEIGMGEPGGMEYPTITGITAQTSGKELDMLIEHEVGHNWFYAILGTNERMYPWMDEGINTYYDNRYEALYYPPAPPPQPANKNWIMRKMPENIDRLLIDNLAKQRLDQPISTASEDFTAQNYDLIAYSKTAFWMRQLEDSLGTPLFDQCMQEYYRRWQFKHPYPEDFRAILEQTAHRDLNTPFALLDIKGPVTPYPAHKKLKPTFLFSARNTDKFNYINIGPAIGYNNYDQFMIGALIHNYNLPPSAFRFFLAPLYATGSHQLNGIGGLSYSWYPHEPARVHQVEIGVTGARFSTLSSADSNGNKIFGGFCKVVPTARLYFTPPSPRSTLQRWIEWKTYLIGENALGKYVLKTADSNYYPTPGKYIFRYLNQLSLDIADNRVLYPYKAQLQFQQGAQFYRINLTGNYFFNYAGGGGMDFRLFAAKFGYLGGGNSSSYDLSIYQPKLTAVRGNEDYTYSNYFIGRNEYTGTASQQIMMRDGDLKLRTDLFQGLQGRSDNWVSSINLSSTLPYSIIPRWLPLKVFVDVGTYAEAWQNNPPTSKFLYVGGLELSLLKNIFHVYAPLFYSSDFSSQLKTVPDQNSFFKKLSFSIDIQNFSLHRSLGNIPL
jgi:peptidase M1-like protein